MTTQADDPNYSLLHCEACGYEVDHSGQLYESSKLYVCDTCRKARKAQQTPMNTPTKQVHTPGPWTAEKVVTHVELGHFAPPAHYQIQAEKTPIGATLVCELRPYGKDNDANARLIASAPALLEALQAFAAPPQASASKEHMIEWLVSYSAKLNQARTAIQAATNGGDK